MPTQRRYSGRSMKPLAALSGPYPSPTMRRSALYTPAAVPPASRIVSQRRVELDEVVGHRGMVVAKQPFTVAVAGPPRTLRRAPAQRRQRQPASAANALYGSAVARAERRALRPPAAGVVDEFLEQVDRVHTGGARLAV